MSNRSSRLLIAEPPLQVLPTLATLIGLNEAIFLQQLHYWILQSGKDRDGHSWIYNTYEDWRAQLPFWSERTIQRIALGLEERGLIVSTQRYNASRMDKTKWYRLDYSAIDQLTEIAGDDDDNLAPSSGQVGTMDDDNLSASLPETTQRKPQRDISNGPPRRLIPKAEEVQISAFVEDYAREFRDRAPLKSSTTRAINLYADSGLALEVFLNLLQSARTATQKRSAGIRAEAEDGTGRKSKMGYFFGVLTDLVNQAA